MMTNPIRMTLLASLLLGGAGAVLAQEMPADLDTDGDGVLTYPELLATFPDLTDEAFLAMDASGDGVLDAAEVAAATEAGLMPMTEG